MTHEELRNKLRTQYQGTLVWQRELKRDNEFDSKDILCCWSLRGLPLNGGIPVVVIIVLEHIDHNGQEHGFNMLVDVDGGENSLDVTFDILDKMHNR